MKIQEFLADNFDCPCNYSPIDEEMASYCGDKCREIDPYAEGGCEKCWEQVFKAYGITNVTEVEE